MTLRPNSHQPRPWHTHYVDPDNPDPGHPWECTDDQAGDEADEWLAEHSSDEPARLTVDDLLTMLEADDGLDDRPLWERELPPEPVYPRCWNSERGCRNLARSQRGGRCNRCDLYWRRHSGHEWGVQPE